MEFSEYSDNQENRSHSCKKHVESSAHTVKSGLVSTITGLTPRASHGGLLSPRHPNINTCAVNNQMKESTAEVDIGGVAHARRHTQPVEHEPALNVTMSPIPMIDTQVENLHHSQSESTSPTPSLPQAVNSITFMTKESMDTNANESKLMQSRHITRSVGREGGGGRKRCYSNQHADTLNLFATNTEQKKSVVLSEDQTTQCTSAHQEHTTCHTNTTDVESQDTKINKNVNDTADEAEKANTSSILKGHAGKMQSGKFHNVTQTSEERAMAFLQELCSSATNNETAQKQSNHHKYSDDMVYYAQQLLRQANDTNAIGSIDLVREVEKLERRIASDAFAAKSEYKPKSASMQHNMLTGDVASDCGKNMNCNNQTHNTISIKEQIDTKEEEWTAKAKSSSRTNSPSPIPVYVRIAKNPQGNYTHYDEFGNVVMSTSSTANSGTNNAHTATKQLEFAARTPMPLEKHRQAEKSFEEPQYKMPVVVNANTSGVECDTIFNAEYPPPPAVGVRNPFFQRKMLVKPVLQPYSQTEKTELENGRNDDNPTQHIARQASLSRRAQNNVECMEDYDTLTLKRARARAASKSQEQTNTNDSKESLSKDSGDAEKAPKRAKVENSNSVTDESITTVDGKTDGEHVSYKNTNNECESDRPRTQRGLLEQQMETKWKAREEAALQHKSGRALTGQNYKKTSLWEELEKEIERLSN